MLHVVSHSHWDREWYLPYEQFRRHLVTLLDQVLDLLDNDPTFASFHLDGQSILVEDYLDVRPDRREQVERHVRSGRLMVGPFYVQQDTFLPGGEAQVRNLLLGVRLAESLGRVALLGYLPDAFGLNSQLPQILRGFGIDNAIFGRGLPPYRAGLSMAGNEQALLAPAPPSAHSSELRWHAPDGSEVLGIFLANWYCNAAEVPEELEEAAAFLRAARDRAASVAITPHLLLLNGCDHQPVQRSIGQIIAQVGPLLQPDIVIHSDLPHYLECVSQSAGQLPSVAGELIDEESDGWKTLVNTASARLYLKKLNRRAEDELVSWAEPFGLWAAILGVREYPAGLLRQAWRYLLQNQAHDSICGCSVDEVHDEMVTRYRKCLQLGEQLAAEALVSLAGAVDAGRPPLPGSVPVVVFNPSPWARTDTVEALIDLPPSEELGECWAVAADGQYGEVDLGAGPVIPDDLGVTTDYRLPPDHFRELYTTHRYRVRFTAHVPGLGHSTYWLVPGANRPAPQATAGPVNSADSGAAILENEHLRVEIAADGTLTIVDRATQRRYGGLNVLEDGGDAGDAYLYRAPAQDRKVSTQGSVAEVQLLERGPAQMAYLVRHRLELPACASADGRGRSHEALPHEFSTVVALPRHARHVQLTVRWNNRCRDHRQRALFPLPGPVTTNRADSPFDIVQRTLARSPFWTNPSNCRRHSLFVEAGGLMVAAPGLPEHEVLPGNGQTGGTIALTLLRSVGRLDDWHTFPTPGAQCLGEQEVKYAITPIGDDFDAAIREAYNFSLPLRAVQLPTRAGDPPAAPPVRLAAGGSLIELSGDQVLVSSIKGGEDRPTMVVRLFNPSDGRRHVELRPGVACEAAWVTGLNEVRRSVLAPAGAGRYSLYLRPKEIVTLQFVPAVA